MSESTNFLNLVSEEDYLSQSDLIIKALSNVALSLNQLSESSENTSDSIVVGQMNKFIKDCLGQDKEDLSIPEISNLLVSDYGSGRSGFVLKLVKYVQDSYHQDLKNFVTEMTTVSSFEELRSISNSYLSKL